eukprot:8999461-Lingulodinium_polyedra.AAC.1
MVTAICNLIKGSGEKADELLATASLMVTRLSATAAEPPQPEKPETAAMVQVCLKLARGLRALLSPDTDSQEQSADHIKVLAESARAGANSNTPEGKANKSLRMVIVTAIQQQ